MHRRPALLLVPLALLFVVTGLVEAWRDAPTVDEAVDIASGVTSVVRHDLRLNPEHGVLARVLPALPALLAHPVVPEGQAYRSDDWFDHTDDFIRANETAGRLHRVVFLSRLVPLLEGLAVAGLLYLLAARLFGPWAGVLAASLWLTTPVFIGFGHVVSIDVAFTVATLATSLALLWYLDARSDRRAIVLGVALGGVLLTRHIGLALLAAVVAVVLVSGWRTARAAAAKQAAVAAVTSWAMVWIVVRLVAPFTPGGPAGAQLNGIIDAGRAQSGLARLVLAVPWPKEWAAGLAFGVLEADNGRQPAYLFGHSWTGSQWWYFIGATIVKLTLVVLVAIVVGAFAVRRFPTDVRRKVVAAIAIPAATIYVAISIQPFDRGLRYAFPCVALCFVVAGAAATVESRRWRRIGLGALALTQAAALAASFPHSIAWTPPPFQPGYRWATDSNIDFGQDNWRVNDWAVGRAPLVDLLLPRGVDPPSGSRPLLSTPASDVRGWVAVSATRLTALDRDALSWLRAYCPVDTIGGSVLVYRFEEPVDSRPGPVMPVGMCSGDVSTRTG